MKRRFVLAWLAVLPWPLHVAAKPGVDPFAKRVTDEKQLRALLSRPAARLGESRVLEGKFRQSRHLREIPKPLVALGDFSFVRDLGIRWHTLQPFDSVVVLTAAGLAQSDDGGAVQRISADEQPAIRLITKIFTALFTLDTPSLARDFDLYTSADATATRWVIGLRPRAKAVAGVFREATIAGGDDVEQVVLTDAQGDRTVIDLSGINYSNEPPGAGLRALFALPRP
jgi:hypothetical protein